MQKVEKRELKTLLILSIVIISGCAKTPVFPTRDLWEIDLKSNVCGQYELTDPKGLKFKHVKDWPIEKCDGVFGFMSSDVPKVLDWCADMIKIGNNKGRKK
jgi:hypothetical protein